MAKKILSALVLWAMLMVLALPCAFGAEVLYQYVTTTPLSKGVFLDEYRLFMSDGTWNNAKVVRSDLTNKELTLDVLYDARGVSYLNTVPNISRENNTLAAINADYFGWGADKSKRGYSIGAAYQGAEILTSPSLQGGMNVMGQDEKGNFVFEGFQWEAQIIAPNGKSEKISVVNKYDDLKGIALYNHHWDKVSLGSYGNLHEMVVKNGVVQEIRFDSEPVPLDKDTIVLATLADWNTFLTDNFKPGDKLEFKIKADPSPESLRMAVGGGAIMVEDGKVPSKYTHVQGGINPLSACGVSKDGKTFYLITVDGRLAQSRGMSQKELSAFMVEVGVYNGLGFDGGGSTTMSVQLPDAPGAQKVVNTPSDGSLRPVSNVLAVTSTGKGNGVPAYLDIIDDGENIWKNTTVQLGVKVTDAYYTPIYVPIEQISWQASGTGNTIKDGLLKAGGTGSVTVTATYNGVRSQKTLRILENPYSITKPNGEITLNLGETKNIWLWAKDELGHSAPFKLSEAVCSMDQELVTVKGTALTAKKKGTAVLSISMGDATAHLTVRVGGDTSAVSLPTDKTGKDSANVTGLATNSGQRALRIAVFGQMRSGDTLFNNLIMSRTINTINSSGADLTAFVSTYTDKGFLAKLKMQTITCDQYLEFTKGDNTIISLNTNGGGVAAGGKNQWSALMEKLKTINTKNLFVFIPTNINFTSAEETKILQDTLSDVAKKDIQVTVFYNNWATAATPVNGVRYLSTPGFSSDITSETVAGRLFKLRYILLDVDKDGKVTYRFMQLY